MLVRRDPSELARERILDIAERLFMERGFNSVRLRDIGSALGLTHAALYYHFPGGKEALFVEVMERNAKRHGAGLGAAIEAAGPKLKPRLQGAADWLISQPPMDLIRMIHSDLTALPAEESRRLMNLIYGYILVPLRGLLDEALARGEIGSCDAGLVSGGVLGMLESLHSVPDFALRKSRKAMAYELLDILLKGLDYREGGEA